MLSGRVQRLLADGGAALPAWPLLAVVCVASATTLVLLGMRLTFFNDEWYLLLQRPGLTLDSIFEPNNQHLTAIPTLVYKALVELFGYDDQLPFRLLLAATVVALGVLVFVYVRERLGNLLALVAATLLLFLGPAWEDLLWSFQIGLVGSLVTGIAALMVLERDSPGRSALACGLLAVSVLLSDLGVPFLAAAGVAVLLRGRPGQLWIPAPAALLFAWWWIAYGSEARSDFAFGNVARLPAYLLDAVAAGLSSLAGLSQGPGAVSDVNAWGRPLVALAVAAIALWVVRGGRPSRQLLVIATAALTFWVLAGSNFIPGREPGASRYILITATFLILLAAELFRGARLQPELQLGVVALALVALGANIAALRNGYEFMRLHSEYARADLGALELTRGLTPPTFQLVEGVAHTPYLSGVTARAYFRETDGAGTPADSTGELTAADPRFRQAADNVLAAGYRLDRWTPAPPPGPDPACRTLAPLADGSPREVALPPGGALVTNLGADSTELAVRRFAPPELPIGVGQLGGGFTARLAVPIDRLALPWHLNAAGSARLRVCPL